MNNKAFSIKGRVSPSLFAISIILFVLFLFFSIVSFTIGNLEPFWTGILLLLLSFFLILEQKAKYLSINEKQMSYHTLFKKRTIPLEKISYVHYDLSIRKDGMNSYRIESFHFLDENRRWSFHVDPSILSTNEEKTLFLNVLKNNRENIIFDEKSLKLLQGDYESLDNEL